MYKLLDLFLALRNQFCLTYTSAKSLCSDSEWSDHPRQKWVTSGEKSKKYGFLSHSRIPRSPLQACKLTWHLSQLKKKKCCKRSVKTPGLDKFYHRMWSFLLFVPWECLKHSLSTVCCCNNKGRRLAVPSQTKAWLSSWRGSLTQEMLMAREQQNHKRNTGTRVHRHI